VDGDTLLHAACRLGQPWLTKSLLSSSASLEIQHRTSLMTPLHVAARNQEVDCLHLLLGARADVHARAKLGATPLILAATQGHLESVRALLAARSPPDVTDDLGLVAAHYAKAFSHRAVSQALKTWNGKASRATHTERDSHLLRSSPLEPGNEEGPCTIGSTKQPAIQEPHWQSERGVVMGAVAGLTQCFLRGLVPLSTPPSDAAPLNPHCDRSMCQCQSSCQATRACQTACQLDSLWL